MQSRSFVNPPFCLAVFISVLPCKPNIEEQLCECVEFAFELRIAVLAHWASFQMFQSVLRNLLLFIACHEDEYLLDGFRGVGQENCANGNDDREPRDGPQITWATGLPVSAYDSCWAVRRVIANRGAKMATTLPCSGLWAFAPCSERTNGPPFCISSRHSHAECEMIDPR